MPAKSEKQRKFLNWKFGHKWVKKHHFDNEGDLPEYADEKEPTKKKKTEEMTTSVNIGAPTVGSVPQKKKKQKKVLRGYSGRSMKEAHAYVMKLVHEFEAKRDGLS